jgi:hypothetical protein
VLLPLLILIPSPVIRTPHKYLGTCSLQFARLFVPIFCRRGDLSSLTVVCYSTASNMAHQVSSSIGYSACFTYPTDLSCMSNRSRSDSGTSGSSASTNGSGRPPRRRSHRPRGCRGGSSRRSRNNSLDDKSAKKSIIQNNSNISSCSNNNNIVIANTKATATNTIQSSNFHYPNTHNSYHESSRRTGHDSSVKYNIDKSKKTDPVPIILTKQRGKNPLQQPYGTEDHMYRLGDRPSKKLFSPDKPYSLYPHSGGGGHDSSSNITATTTIGEESFSSLSRNPATDFDLSSSFGYDTSSYYQQPASSFELPMLHQSYSDSSSEGIIYDNQNSYESHMHNDSGCHILPPMPSTEFLQNERPPVSTGPNPYALKLGSAHGNVYLPRHQQQNQGPAGPQEMVKFMDSTNFSSSAGRHHRQPTQQHKLERNTMSITITTLCSPHSTKPSLILAPNSIIILISNNKILKRNSPSTIKRNALKSSVRT